MKIINNQQWEEYQQLKKSFDKKVRDMDNKYYQQYVEERNKSLQRIQSERNTVNQMNEDIIQRQRKRITELLKEIDCLQGIKNLARRKKI